MTNKNEKRKRPDPLTLAPLSFEEALEGLLQVPPPPKDEKATGAHESDKQEEQKDK